MPPDKRRGPPGGSGPSSGNIADQNDRTVDNPQPRKKQALLRRRSDFARAMVFEVFKYKDARALDFDGFTDRKPRQAFRQWGAST